MRPSLDVLPVSYLVCLTLDLNGLPHQDRLLPQTRPRHMSFPAGAGAHLM